MQENGEKPQGGIRGSQNFPTLTSSNIDEVSEESDDEEE